MGPGTIQKTIALFRDAFDGLDVDIPLIRLEELSTMVHEAMTVQTRHFHTPDHIFSLADGRDPIQALAALFHDVVYYEVDEGFIPCVERVLSPYILKSDGEIRLVNDISPDDTVYYLSLDVFGLRADDTLVPSYGQNEFLSALLMNEQLQGLVRSSDLVKITACIEATIPFRGCNEAGELPAEILERRLRAMNVAYGFGMTRDKIRAAVKRAVAFSNKDVENFSERDTGRFLDNTWKLLPESNPSLRLHGIYTIVSYRRALQRMERFLRGLDPETIFNRYDDEPSLGKYERMCALAYRNVNTARQYLGIKLLAIAVLEALATVTGGDAPVALFMGAIDGDASARRLENFLPDVSTVPSVNESSTLFGLLAFGRASSSSFDLQNSPLALFLFKLLGWDRAQGLLVEARTMFSGEIDGRMFLRRMPSQMIVPIARACAEMASTRGAALRAYAEMRMRDDRLDTSVPIWARA